MQQPNASKLVAFAACILTTCSSNLRPGVLRLEWNMGRPSLSGGVSAVGNRRIRYDFVLNGTRYRPSINQPPTEDNLRRAREHLKQIKQRILEGTFNYAEEFPRFQDTKKNCDHSHLLTCNDVFDGFMAHCEACVERGEYSPSTFDGYRRNLDIWRTDLGAMLFLAVTFSTLTMIADTHRRWSRKTYNNSLSVLRRAFAFGYRDHPQSFNPASALKPVRLHPREQPKADPFRIVEAEALVAGIHADWGEAQGNYDEFRLFTGLRPSEEIALIVHDYDAARGTLAVTKACVRGIYKDCTKTRQDRVIELNPRAIGILQRQIELRERLRRAGRINHERLFFHQDGRPICSLIGPGHRWRKTLKRLNIRYRRPYVARHTSVSWNLMIGRSPLYNAKQHGHSIATMWKVYSAWTQGASESEIKMIRQAMQSKRAPRPFLTGFRAVLRPVGETIHRIRGMARSAWRWRWG